MAGRISLAASTARGTSSGFSQNSSEPPTTTSIPSPSRTGTAVPGSQNSSEPIARTPHVARLPPVSCRPRRVLALRRCIARPTACRISLAASTARRTRRAARCRTSPRAARCRESPSPRSGPAHTAPHRRTLALPPALPPAALSPAAAPPHSAPRPSSLPPVPPAARSSLFGCRVVGGIHVPRMRVCEVAGWGGALAPRLFAGDACVPGPAQHPRCDAVRPNQRAAQRAVSAGQRDRDLSQSPR